MKNYNENKLKRACLSVCLSACMHACFIFVIIQQLFVHLVLRGWAIKQLDSINFISKQFTVTPTSHESKNWILLSFLNIPCCKVCRWVGWRSTYDKKPVLFWNLFFYVTPCTVHTAFHSTCWVVRYKQMVTNLLGAQSKGVACQDSSVRINREDESGSRHSNNHRVSALWVYMQVILIIQQQDTTQGLLVAFMQEQWLFNLITKSYQSIRLSKRLPCNGVEHKQHTFTCHLMNN